MNYETLAKVASVIGRTKHAGVLADLGKKLSGPGSTLGGIAGRYAPHALLGYGGYKGYKALSNKYYDTRARAAQRSLLRRQQKAMIEAAKRRG